MNKLEKLYLNLINKNNWRETEFTGLHTFENEKSFTEINAEIVSQKSAEITIDIVVKFGNWLKKEMVVKKGRYYFKGDFYNQQKKEPTTQELFEIFINNHYEKS